MGEKICEMPKSSETREELKQLLIWIEKSQYCNEVNGLIQFEWIKSSWKIIHITQAHHDLHKSWETTLSPNFEKLIVQQNELILREIQTIKPDLILLEWNPWFTMEKPSIYWYLKEIFNDELYNKTIHLKPIEDKLFKMFLVKDKQNLRKRLLFLYWWGAVYGATNYDNWVVTESAEDQNLNTQLMLFFKSHPSWKSGNTALNEASFNEFNNINLKREEFVIQKAKKYLTENPWKTVVIIYGVAHDFSRAYKAVFPITKNSPQLERFTFPKIQSQGAAMMESWKTKVSHPRKVMDYKF